MGKKVSVIVPTYNSEKYITKCIDNLINQTLSDIEIIVVDDGSTDNTLEILKKYKNKIKILKQKNAGPASARNNAMKIVTGKYIGFVDSDDYVDTTMFEKLYNKAISSDFDFVECDFFYFNDEKKWKGVVDCKKDILTFDYKKNYFLNMYPVIWNKLYKASILKKFEFKNGVWAEDVEFLYRLLPYINKIGKVNERLYYYYQRSNSDSNTFNNKVYDYIYNFNGLLEYYKKNNFFHEYKKEFEYCYVRYLYATFLKRVIKLLDKNEYNKAIEMIKSNVKTNFPKYRYNSYFYKSIKGLYLVIFNKFIANILYKIM